MIRRVSDSADIFVYLSNQQQLQHFERGNITNNTIKILLEEEQHALLKCAHVKHYLEQFEIVDDLTIFV